MKNIVIGPTDKDRAVTQQILKNVRTQSQKPSDDRTEVCNVLRLAKGGYSHRRSRGGQHIR